MIHNICGYDVLIDDEDLPLIAGHHWSINTRDLAYGYYRFSTHTRYKGKYVSIGLHRLIMGCTYKDGTNVDHINHNTLDNRKCNLRLATVAENSRNGVKQRNNTSGYKGVSYHKRDKVYFAQIRLFCNSIFIGQSKDPIECAKMYDIIAIKLHGEFAYTNFPKENYSIKEIDNLYDRVFGKVSANNTSGYRGVCFDKSKNKWVSYIFYNKRLHRLGNFDEPKQAALAYDAEAIKIRGINAELNFPEGVK